MKYTTVILILFVSVDAFAQNSSHKEKSGSRQSSTQAPLSTNGVQDVEPNLFEEWGNKIVSASSQYDGVFELTTTANRDAMIGVTSSNSSHYEVDAYLQHLAKGLGSSLLIKQGIGFVKYTEQNGPISRGDYITISSEPGVGMKATKDGFTVGVALEDSNNTEKEGLLKIRVMVRYEKF